MTRHIESHVLTQLIHLWLGFTRTGSETGWAGQRMFCFFSFGETALTAHRLTPDSAQSQISNTTDSLLIEL